MNKRITLAIAMALAVGALGVFASSALAHPNSGVCSNCHSLSSSVVVQATMTGNDGVNAAYHVSISGPRAGFGWAVYEGTSRKTYGSGASGTFSVVAGKTYTVYGGNADGSAQLYNKVTISPAASTNTSPTPGTTSTPVPAPTPDPKVKYVAHFNLHHHYYKNLRAVLTGNGHKYLAWVNRKGNATFSVPAGSYRLSVTGNKHYKFKAKTISIGISEEDDD
jgi:hypothetical protein